MKVKEFETYRAQYCGVCKQLQKNYGAPSRFFLNYDLVLLSVLADALSGEQGTVRHEGCFANPIGKRCTQHDTSGLRLAADSLILLSYHRFLDNIHDERGPKRLLYWLFSPYLKGKYKKAARCHPHVDEVLSLQMKRQFALEAAGCPNVDEACDPTAKMCEALFSKASTKAEEQRILARLGLFAGQIVYLLDAAEDYMEDVKKGRYNVFVRAGLDFEETVEATRQRCRMAAGEIALCYNLLHPVQHQTILNNIIFLGLPAGIAAAGMKRTGRAPKHGQIESL